MRVYTYMTRSDAAFPLHPTLTNKISCFSTLKYQQPCTHIQSNIQYTNNNTKMPAALSLLLVPEDKTDLAGKSTLYHCLSINKVTDATSLHSRSPVLRQSRMADRAPEPNERSRQGSNMRRRRILIRRLGRSRGAVYTARASSG